MIVAGWADGYRNNSFRTVAELARHGTPHRLLAGPWAHADPTTAMPGPRIDFAAELAAWFDRWLRGRGEHEDRCDVFVRTSTRPEIDLDLHEGRWLTLPSVPPVTEATLDLTAPVTLRVAPDVGTAAWIDCAGHLPWGLSGDQRLDDERSLTWEVEPPPSPVVGHPVLRARLWATEPAASISVKLCDVFPDGTSALVVTRHARPRLPRRRARLAVTARPWPRGARSRSCSTRAPTSGRPATRCASRSPVPTGRTPIAPPAPLDDHPADGVADPAAARRGRLSRPRPSAPARSTRRSPPRASAGRSTTTCSPRTTSATTRSDSRYRTPYDGTAHELYLGEVSVDTRTFAQGAQGQHRLRPVVARRRRRPCARSMTADRHRRVVRRVDLGARRPRQRGDQPRAPGGVDPALSAARVRGAGS